MKNSITLIFLAITALFFTACESEKFVESTLPENQTEAFNHLPEDITAEYYNPKQENFLVVLPRDNDFITIPAGSVDALEAAIESADEGGIIYLEAGTHTLTKRLTITKAVKIIGEQGALLYVTTINEGSQVDPGIHILNAPETSIQNVIINPIEGTGWNSILVENSPYSALLSSSISDFRIGLIVQNSDFFAAIGNTIKNSVQQGILSANGESVYIGYNTFMGNGAQGVWANDKWGTMEGNTFLENRFGTLLCRFPAENGISTPSGAPLAAEVTCTGWKVRSNHFLNNIRFGINIRDGAIWNLIEQNNLYSGNFPFDINIPPDAFSNALQIFIPAALDNTIFAEASVLIRDCGVNNTIIGGTLTGNCN